MGDMTKNFNRSEVACKCGCGFDTIDVQVMEFAEAIRDHFRSPVTVNSGCRCETYNARVGGATASQHLRGRALDITVRGVPSYEVRSFAETLIGQRGGVGGYQTFTHIDSRGSGARWSG